jgi:glutamine amidotransferase
MKVTVIDYGIGNLFSVGRALERCGAEVTFSGEAAHILAAERLVLPGVGAFSDGMLGLRDRGLVKPIQEFAASGRPLLGICLGMQMMATQSEEFGEHTGLGLIPGRVVPVPATDTAGNAHKIPHIGWSALRPSPGASWAGTPLQDLPEGSPVYLVHSFHVVPDDARDLLGECLYGGHRVTAAIRRGAITGLQFHPEKSGELGLRVLSTFLRQ